MQSRSKPLYLRIGDHLRDRIGSGEFGPGDKLPSESELAEKFSTTRATVARALQELVHERAITRRPGSGSFVSKVDVSLPLETTHIRSFEDQMAEDGQTIAYELLSFSRDDSARATTKLNCESAYKLERLRLVSDRPVSLERRYLPKELGDQMTVAALSSLSIHRILEEIARKPVTHIEGSIRVTLADEALATLLRTAVGAPLLIRDYVLSSDNHEVLIQGESFYTEEFRIPYHVGQADAHS